MMEIHIILQCNSKTVAKKFSNLFRPPVECQSASKKQYKFLKIYDYECTMCGTIQMEF